MEWGKKNESVALQAYIKQNEDLGNKSVIVSGAGFVICKEHPFLGASPDGYVHDPQSEQIKCPFKYRNCSPIDAVKQSLFVPLKQVLLGLMLLSNVVMHILFRYRVKWQQQRENGVILWFTLPKEFPLRGLPLMKPSDYCQS